MTEQTLYCAGCGIPIQTDDPNKSGYVPPKALEQDNVVCRRCFRIRHYNEVSPTELTADDYRAILEQIGAQNALVVYMIDLFDVEGSWVRGLPRYIGDNPVMVVANKVDLLPGSVKRAHIENWLRRLLKEWGMRPADVVLCSVKKNENVDDILRRMETLRAGRDVYVVGATNVGKSSFINRIIKDYGGGAGNEITTSFYPGTTLGTVRIVLEDGKELVDTPGIVNNDRMTERLLPADLPFIVPRGRINPKVYQLNAGQTLFMAGLARLDFKRGNRQPFVCYAANDLYIHRTKTERADELYREHVGEMLSPPSKGEAIPPFFKRSYHIDGEKTDVVVSGLGWITLRGDVAEVDIYAPRGVAVALRTAMI